MCVFDCECVSVFSSKIYFLHLSISLKFPNPTSHSLFLPPSLSFPPPSPGLLSCDLDGAHHAHQSVLSSDILFRDKVAFACCFLPDELLLGYLTATAEEFTSKGNLEGLIVSELGEGRREGERERGRGRREGGGD